MRRIIRCSLFGLSAFLAAYLWLAQPGLCPYWLVGNVARLSAEPADGADAPHHSHHHHDHNEQRQLFVTATAPALPQPLLLLTALLAWLAATAPRLCLAERRLAFASVSIAPPLPPPRLPA